MRVDFFEDDGGDELGEVCCCPVCDKPWLVLEEDDADYPDGCPHLRFVVTPMLNLEQALYRNGMTYSSLVEGIGENYRRIFPDGEAVGADMMLSELLGEEDDDDEVREQIELTDVDVLVSYTQRTPGDNFTHLFGAKLSE